MISGYFQFMAYPPVLVLVASLILPATANPASPRDALLISEARLAPRLKDPNLVLLHVGDRADYASGHIEGARRLLPSWPAGNRSALRGADAWPQGPALRRFVRGLDALPGVSGGETLAAPFQALALKLDSCVA